MKHNRVISTAVLFLLLGTTIPAFAQKGEEEKGGGGGKSRAGATPGATAARQQQPQQRAARAAAAARPTAAQASSNRSAAEGTTAATAAADNTAPAPNRRGSRKAQNSRQPWQAANMAAFLTPITVPISVMATRSTWDIPR